MNNSFEALLNFLISKKYVYKLNEPLSLHTTVRIGGPADIWFEAPSREALIEVIKKAREENIPVTVLGRGSNTLISDAGIRGIVIRNTGSDIKIGESLPVKPTPELKAQIESRWNSDTQKGTFRGVEFKDLDYDESNYPRVLVKMDSGVDMPFAINYLIQQGITGLQWYSRIPGNLGGWIFNNVHGGTHFIHEVIKEVEVLDTNSNPLVLTRADLGLDYDKSRFHSTNEVILGATLELFRGDAEKAKYVVAEWAKRKSSQSPVSLGSVFKNISQEDKERLGYPTTSVGYIVEHVVKMSGFHVGDAYISPSHHNFIENKGNATAKDYKAVITEIQKRVKTTTGIEIEPEIFFLGEF